MAAKMKDLAGKRFGSWAVIRPSTKRGSDGSVFWECLCDCGRKKLVRSSQLIGGRSSSCRKGECAPAWAGGRQITTFGYVSIYAPDHPNGHARGRIYEHVKVMSEHLGRPIRKGESIHHLNGVRDDNRIENLELWSTRHPAGQRIPDKIKHYIEELKFYFPEVLK